MARSWSMVIPSRRVPLSAGSPGVRGSGWSSGAGIGPSTQWIGARGATLARDGAWRRGPTGRVRGAAATWANVGRHVGNGAGSAGPGERKSLETKDIPPL